MLSEKSRSAIKTPEHWLCAVELALAVAVTYFLAARLGLALQDSGVAAFWPAAGIAVGILVVLGPHARIPVAAGIVVGSAAAGLTAGRNGGLVVTFAFVNAAQALFTVWILEYLFGRAAVRLGDVRQVLGFLAASAAGAAISAVGAAVAISMVRSVASPLNVWRLWFAGGLLGVVTVAPLIIAVPEMLRALPPRRELREGTTGLVVLAALIVFLVSLPDGPWGAALPESLIFPILLWIAIRFRPVFAAAAAFVVALVIIGSTVLGIGHFSDASLPIANRVLAAQTFVLAAAVLVLLLSALFVERRHSEAELKASSEHLQLALDGARLGAFSADLATGRIEFDARATRLHGHEVPPVTIRESRRFVHPDDLVRIDAAVAEARRVGGVWRVEYRVMDSFGSRAEEMRWIGLEGSVLFDEHGKPVGLRGVTRDITYRKRSQQALAERDTQLALAGKVARVGTFTFDLGTGKMHVSPGYATIHGLPDRTQETPRSEWRARVHPDDLPRFDADRQRCIEERRREQHSEYRIVLPGGTIRWIESRALISYDADGRAQRIFGANIDVTDRRKTEAVIKESQTRLAAALTAGQVMAFEWDAATGETHRSDNATAILGEDHAGVCGGPCEDLLSRVHSDDQMRVRKHLRELSPENASYALSFRYCRPDGQQVWLEETGRGEFDSTGRLLRVRGLTRDISERKRAELALAERTMQLELAGKAALVGSFAYDLGTDKLQTSEGYAAIHGFPDGTTEVPRSQWKAGVHPEDRARLEELRSRAFRDHRCEYEAEYRIVRPSGEIRWIEGRCFFAYHSDGQPQRAVGVDIDVTEHKRAEEHQRALRAELDHRVKNVLATVSAVAAHTMDASSSMPQFVAALDGRIRSMASTHELLSDRRWESVPLQSLLWRELEPYASKTNTNLDGPEVLLSAEAGQTIASVFHELATNAAKHGALSTRQGKVAVQWSHRRNGRTPGCLTIDWHESGGPRVKVPKQSGYGTNIITELVPYELGGAAELAYPPDGVRCRLDIPGEWLRPDRQRHA